jgi:hypothetical protein
MEKLTVDRLNQIAADKDIIDVIGGYTSAHGDVDINAYLDGVVIKVYLEQGDKKMNVTIADIKNNIALGYITKK